jgi:hypothetical protein
MKYITKDGDAWDVVAKRLLGDEFKLDVLALSQYRGTLRNGFNALDYLLLPNDVIIETTDRVKADTQIFRAPWE